LLTRPLRAVEGKTLLHLAAESGCNLAVVQRVASEFPESAEHQVKIPTPFSVFRHFRLFPLIGARYQSTALSMSLPRV